MQRPPRRRLNLAACVIVASWVLSLGINAPGHLSYDSVVQLQEGRSGVFQSMHPPVMSVLLGLADGILPGTGLYLVIATAPFFIGLLLACRGAEGRRAASLIALALLALALLNPFLLVYQGIVWKDVLFANLAVLAFALAGTALDQPPGPRRVAAAIAAALLAGVAATIRQQGLLMPLALGVVTLLAVPRGTGWARRAASAAVILGVSLGTMAALGAAVRSAAVSPPADPSREGLLLLQGFDVMGMAARGVPVPVGGGLGRMDAQAVEAYARRYYTPTRLDPVVPEPLPAAFDRLDIQPMWGIWKAMVLASPGAYLAHRAAVLRWQIWPPDVMQCLPIHVGVEGAPARLAELNLAPGARPGDQRLYAMATPWFETPLFRGGAWILASLAILLILVRRRLAEAADLAVAALQVSAILFAASYALVGIACDLRYLFLLPAAVCLGLAHLARGRRAGGRQPGSAGLAAPAA